MFPFSSPKFTPENDLLDLTGKVVFITGANHGIGYATVKHLARRGAKVYIGSRSEEKGLAAVASLELELANLPYKGKGKGTAKGPTPGQVIYHHCDISTPAQAKESAEKLIEKEQRLDILINNAGLLADKALMDQILMVNHFGTFQITQTLLPLMIKTAQEPDSDVRIVYVGSNAHRLGRAKDPNIHFKTEADFKPDTSKDWFPAFSMYSISKLTNILTLKALQRRVAEHNITCLAVHPGAVNTFTDRLPLGSLLLPIVKLFFVTPDVGAYTSCFAAASPLVKADPKKYRGAYLVPIGKVVLEGENARSEALQDEIYDSTVRILGEWEAKGPE